MHILILTSTFPDQVASYSASFINVLTQYLAKQGHRVTIVTQRRPETPPDDCPTGVSIRRFEFSGWRTNMTWATLRSIPVASTLSYLWRMLRTARAVMRERRVDVIHCFWVIPSGFLGVLIKGMSRIPLIVTAPGSDLNVWVKRRTARPFIAFTVRHADRLIVLGEQMKATALKLGGRQERIVSMLGNGGVDLSRFHPSPVEEKARLRAELGFGASDVLCLFIGRLGPPKLIGLLVEAIRLAREQIPMLKLLLVGGGAWDAGQFDRRLMDELVVSYGPQPPERLPSYLGAADLFLYASTMEGIPLAIVEAMACGLPVIASQVGGIPDVVLHGQVGFTVANDPGAFAGRIVELARQESLRSHMGERAHCWAAAALSSQSILPQIERIYEQVGGPHAGQASRT